MLLVGLGVDYSIFLMGRVRVGILMDTFIVRALLVPSLAVLLGRWNWWPSVRASAD